MFNVKNKKQKVVVFGTGSGAINFAKRVNKTHEIVCFLDNNEKKQGQTLNGISISSPDAIEKFPKLDVIIASQFYEEIHAALRKNKKFDNTKIIFYRALDMKVPLPLKERVLSYFAEKSKDLVCQTPSLLMPLANLILKIFDSRLVRISSLDMQVNHRVQLLRESKIDVAVGPKTLGKVQNRSEVELPAVAMYQFNHCRTSVLSRVFVESEQVIVEKTHTVNDSKAKYNKGPLIHHYKDQLGLVRVGKATAIEKGMIINGFYDQNYYHWVIDIIPQLSYIEEFDESYNDYPILISETADKIHSIKDLLRCFEIKREIRFLPQTQDYIVDDLLVISSPNRCCPRIKGPAWSKPEYTFCRFESVLHIRNLVLQNTSSELAELHKRVFLAPSMKHRIYNQEEVFAPLAKMGFVKVNPENMSLAQQAHIFNQADIIIGPTGATWTNLIFAKQGAKALCWMAEEWGDFSAFSNLADKLGVEMEYLTYKAGADDHIALYSQPYVVNEKAVFNWAKKQSLSKIED